MRLPELYEKMLFLHAIVPYKIANGKALPPVRVQIEVTGRCNLKCSFCYQGALYKNAKDELAFDQIVKLIDQVGRFSLLTFSGGEPLMRKDIFDIVSYALNKKRLCNMITNGVLLDERILKLMVDKKFFLLNVSIDGLGQVHDEIRGVPGTFRKVIDNLKFLREYKEKRKSRLPLVDVKLVLNNKNLTQLVDLYSLCEDMGVSFLTVSLQKEADIQFNGSFLYQDLNNECFYKRYPPKDEIVDKALLISSLKEIEDKNGKVHLRFYPRFRSSKEIELYLNSRERAAEFASSCLEPWSGLQINAFGDVYPCLSLKVGNIKENTISQIWNSGPYVEFRKKLKKLSLFPACSGCCYLKIRRLKWKA